MVNNSFPAVDAGGGLWMCCIELLRYVKVDLLI
jgi:hypothetical protein